MKFVSSSYVIKFIIAIFLFFQSVGRASNSLNNELQAIATKYKNVSIGVDDPDEEVNSFHFCSRILYFCFK